MAALGSGTTVLVVDDAAVDRKLVSNALERAGYSVVGAPTAARALELLEQLPFDCVLLDVNMPGQSGA
jgi:CheY-like chemotaxis protein